MKVGDLVRIRCMEHHGLFVVRLLHDDGLWCRAYSFRRGDNHNLRIGALELAL